MSNVTYAPPRTALFLPASNPRAIEKAKGLPADMIILDLEDAVKDGDKDRARAAVREVEGFGDRPFAVRVNARDSDAWKDDLKAVRKSKATHVILPKVEEPETITYGAYYSERPVIAMIETAAGVMNVGPIASTTGWRVEMAGLIVGPNDLAASLKLPPNAGRESMAMAMQLVLLAARGRGLWALDGVYNKLEDPEGLAADAHAGRLLGFDGKCVIHPNQIDIVNAAFNPSAQEIADAEALIAAATGGAERYRGEMVEQMHVDQARELLARASRVSMV